MPELLCYKTFKVALSYQINQFPNKNDLRSWHTYIIINGFYEGIGVEFEKKSNTTLVFLLSSCPQVLKIFYD